MGKISRINPILEIARSSPQRIQKIWIQKDKREGRVEEIIRTAKAANIPLLFIPKKRLDQIERDHQGAVALVAMKEFVPLASLLASSGVPFLVLLDGVEDPQNLGAIIRSAEGAGVDGIILPERRAVGLTQTVASVSAGAAEYVKIARVKNLARTIDVLKESGIWVVGAEGDAPEPWYEFDYTLPVALVLGSEGKGLRPLIKKKCDKILSIPLLGRITSLNVASAASIFFFEVVRQRIKKESKGG
ncbi:MAG: RNA methyltransferase TrmH [candidate division Zixibacteria bacterium SM1_73]|nr:MAG: RNA methyltransferase TrmH [candidate division Zixibacteria bacterium SM1_73]